MDLAQVLMASAAAEHDSLVPTQYSEGFWIMCLEPNPAPGSTSALPEGKWMLFYKRAQLDAAWARAKQKFRAGQLPGVHSMKVSTNRLNPNSPDPSTGVIIFYCGSSSDMAGTKAVGNTVLAAMAYTGGGCNRSTKRVNWKSDQQTMQGVYANRGKRASTFSLSYAGIKADA